VHLCVVVVVPVFGWCHFHFDLDLDFPSAKICVVNAPRRMYLRLQLSPSGVSDSSLTFTALPFTPLPCFDLITGHGTEAASVPGSPVKTSVGWLGGG
jgi:hypothetical protein